MADYAVRKIHDARYAGCGGWSLTRRRVVVHGNSAMADVAPGVQLFGLFDSRRPASRGVTTSRHGSLPRRPPGSSNREIRREEPIVRVSSWIRFTALPPVRPYCGLQAALWALVLIDAVYDVSVLHCCWHWQLHVGSCTPKRYPSAMSQFLADDDSKLLRDMRIEGCTDWGRDCGICGATGVYGQ